MIGLKKPGAPCRSAVSCGSRSWKHRISPLHFILLAFSVVLAQAGPAAASPDTLRVLSFNLWHGKARTGILSMQSLEGPGRQEERLQGFLGLVRQARPDVVFLQEANPAPEVARRLAGELQMEEVHQVCNGGLRFFVGFPASFQEGLVILARRELGLERLASLKLPGSGLGRCGDRFSFQLDEQRYLLAGRISWRGRHVLVAGTHLHHTPALDGPADRRLKEALEKGEMPEKEDNEVRQCLGTGVSRRQEQVRAVIDFLAGQDPDLPVILAGDFNAWPDSSEIRSLVQVGGYIDTYGQAGDLPGFTWDPGRNPNIRANAGSFWRCRTSTESARRILQDLYMRERRIDYVFLRPRFPLDEVRSSMLFADNPLASGLFCSDHFGVLATIGSTR